jgi:hypothetical protein
VMSGTIRVTAMTANLATDHRQAFGTS